MLKLIQKVVSSKELLDFTQDAEWSDNILPVGTLAYEITINGDSNNRFSLNGSREPFVITTAQNNITKPIALYLHATPATSLHIHKDNTYNTSTIINILVSVDGQNLDQWLNELGELSGDFEELKRKVQLMYGEAFSVEDQNLGDRLLFLEDQINPDLWSNRNYKLSVASAIGGWGDMFEEEQIGNTPIWDITTAIYQGLIWNDTYLEA